MPQHGWTRVDESAPPSAAPGGWTPVQETPEESGVPTATAADMLTRRGISSDTSDSPERFSGLHQMLRGVAQPESASDMLPLLIPNAMGAVGNAARAYIRTAKEALSEGSTARQLPGRMLGKLYGKAFPAAEPVSNATGSVRWDPPPEPPPPTPPHLDLSRQVKAGSMTREQMAERFAKVKAEGYTPPPPEPKSMLGGRLRMAPPTEAPPIAVEPAGLPESWKQFAEPPAASAAPPPPATYDRPMWSRDPGGPGPGAMSVKETAENLRALYGSKEAAQRLGVSVEAIERLAPGPSRIPTMQRVSTGYQGVESLDQGFARGVSDPRGIGTTEAVGGIAAAGGMAEAVRRAIRKRLTGER